MRQNRESDLLRMTLKRAYPIAEICRRIGCSRQELNQTIRELQLAGYHFQQEPGWLQAIREPEHLIPESILARLEGPTIGKEIAVLKETSSTMDRIRQAGEGGAEEGLVVFAETQVSGRGRFGRKWSSPPGTGLWFSILLRAQSGKESLSWIIQAIALATVEALDPFLPGKVKIKQPNDLVVDGAKLAGFLLESPAHGGFQILGAGINIRSAPQVRDYPTTFVDRYSSFPTNRPQLAALILARFEYWYKSGNSVALQKNFDLQLQDPDRSPSDGAGCATLEQKRTGARLETPWPAIEH